MDNEPILKPTFGGRVKERSGENGSLNRRESRCAGDEI